MQYFPLPEIKNTEIHMHLCFVDESGIPTRPSQGRPGFFTIGGIIIPEKHWHEIRRKFLCLKDQNNYRGEVKWRYFAPNNDDPTNPMLEWDEERRNDFRLSLFNIIIENNAIKLICCVCNTRLAYNLRHVNNQEDVYFQTYKAVTERFQYFLQDLSPKNHTINGIIVADQRNRRQDNHLRVQHENLVRKTSKNTANYENFIETLFFVPSDMSVGMQLADMVAGATYRYFSREDDRWIEHIRGAFRTDARGKIKGYGVVHLPKSNWSGPVFN